MHLIDLAILLILAVTCIRGFEVGMVRQLFSTLGFLLGLVGGVHAATFFTGLSSSSVEDSILSSICILGMSLVGMIVGESLAMRLQRRRLYASTKLADGIAGATVSVATALVGVWFASIIIALNGSTGILSQLNSSAILGSLHNTMPPPSKFLATLSTVIDQRPPVIFTGDEPSPQAIYPQPPIELFRPIVGSVSNATFKIEGIGCGGLMDGTGFAIAPGYIATNAHVVAGISRPRIIHDRQTVGAQVVWFSAYHDLAVLYSPELTAKPLPMSSRDVQPGEPLLLIGFPEGGNRQIQTAVALETVRAKGQDIYGQGKTLRSAMSLQAKIVQGNSGGAVVAADGQVVGIVFATSTTYNNIGYALAGAPLRAELLAATTKTEPVATQPCVP